MSGEVSAWQVVEHGAPIDALRLTEIELPRPGVGEVVLEVSAAALGLPDALMCRGTYDFKPTLPFTPGQEMCGTVAAVGDDVSLSIGDKVLGVSAFFLGHGSFAARSLSNQSMLYPVPAGMSDAHAAAFNIGYQTAWIGLVERGQLRSGETLVVLGAAGGSGCAAVQLGKALGATVIAIAAGPQRARFCQSLGAREVIDRASCDVSEAVKEMTGGAGADVIYDPVGAEAFEGALNYLGNGGRLLAVGFAAGRWGQADTHALVLRNASVMGVYAGAYTIDQRLQFHHALCRLWAQGSLNPVVREAPFLEVPQLLEGIEQGTVSGKVVVHP
ncbi:MAG: NADPH:quinone oxidoreductase family protein [Pseudomonadota bacterium]